MTARPGRATRLRHRGQADVIGPAPERGSQRGHVRDKAGVLAGRHHGVARRDEEAADVAHQWHDTYGQPAGVPHQQG